MDITLDVPEYSPTGGISYHWEDESEITVLFKDGEVKISANAPGLRTLANHLLNLAQEGLPTSNYCSTNLITMPIVSYFSFYAPLMARLAKPVRLPASDVSRLRAMSRPAIC